MESLLVSSSPFNGSLFSMPQTALSKTSRRLVFSSAFNFNAQKLSGASYRYTEACVRARKEKSRDGMSKGRRGERESEREQT